MLAVVPPLPTENFPARIGLGTNTLEMHSRKCQINGQRFAPRNEDFGSRICRFSGERVQPATYPCNLNSQRALSLSHGLKYGGLMAVRASRRFGGLLWEMDRALARESIAQLTDDDLQQCCFMRGFNPVALSRSEAEKYLDRWLQVSLELQGKFPAADSLIGSSDRLRLQETGFVLAHRVTCFLFLLADREYSLLLHAPIFLAYNHKNNFGRTFL